MIDLNLFKACKILRSEVTQEHFLIATDYKGYTDIAENDLRPSVAKINFRVSPVMINVKLFRV